ENQSLHYDFSNLSSVGSLMNGPSFTSKGTKYFHFFNISLCGHEKKKTFKRKFVQNKKETCRAKYQLIRGRRWLSVPTI
ncbi:KIAA1324L isoform 8, partial [Pan troglodytes]